MLNAILGQKLEMVQKFNEQGQRMPVTQVKAGPCHVVQVKTNERDHYQAIQLGWGEKEFKKINQPLKGHFKKANLKKAPLFLREIRLEKDEKVKAGDEIKASSIFKPGDKVKVTGTAKGKGFTGVMKRWGFHGGPRTHGQSDRPRSPGSIGQGTTPGRVHKGKKMPGRSGGQQVTVKNLMVTDIDEKNDILEIKGLLPGSTKGYLLIQKENGKS